MVAECMNKSCPANCMIGCYQNNCDVISNEYRHDANTKQPFEPASVFKANGWRLRKYHTKITKSLSHLCSDLTSRQQIFAVDAAFNVHGRSILSWLRNARDMTSLWVSSNLGLFKLCQPVSFMGADMVLFGFIKFVFR